MQDHDQDTAGIVYTPAGDGTGLAWLGTGTIEDDPYDIDRGVVGLCQWAVAATGTRPDPEKLRELITPNSDFDLLARPTAMCHPLGVTLPPKA